MVSFFVGSGSKGLVLLSVGVVSFVPGVTGSTGGFSGSSTAGTFKNIFNSSRESLPSASVSALVKAASSSASVRFYPLDTKAALISCLVREPSASESAVVKNTVTSCTVAFSGRTLTGAAGSTG